MSSLQPFEELLRLRQVAFQETSNNGLSPPTGVERDHWATHLAYISSREPKNLLNHVRRVFIHLKLKQPDPLYGALVDLYIALGDKGDHLRFNLLKKAKRLISQEQYELFLTHFQQGLQPHHQIPASQYSVLGNFFIGEMRYVRDEQIQQQADNHNHDIDPLELSRQELSYGNTAVAQQILEEALMQSPSRLGLHYSLLEIYRHTRSLDDLLSMEKRLGEDIGITQTAWNQTKKALLNEI
jgi:hypothetical protein